MKLNAIYKFLSLAILVFIVGCKDEAKDGSSSSSSTAVVTDKTQNTGCVVERVEGGVNITCGASSAFLADGQAGTPGPQGASGNPGAIGATGAQGPRGPMGASAGNGAMPRLIDGDGQVVGDYLIAVDVRGRLPKFFMVWDSANDAVATYEDGVLGPQAPNLYYQEHDCVGTPAVLGSLMGGTDMKRPTGYIFKVGAQFYKATDQKFLVGPHSRKDHLGNCSVIGPSELSSGFYWGYTAEPISTNVPVSLKEGYMVKVR